MPLLSDSKTCYCGTTPITKVMAAGVQVWPKGGSSDVEYGLARLEGNLDVEPAGGIEAQNKTYTETNFGAPYYVSESACESQSLDVGLRTRGAPPSPKFDNFQFVGKGKGDLTDTINLTKGFTFSYYFKFQAVDPLSASSWTPYFFQAFGDDSNCSPHVFIKHVSGSALWSVEGISRDFVAPYLLDDVWHHFAYCLSPENGTLQFFLDGTSMYTGSGFPTSSNFQLENITANIGNGSKSPPNRQCLIEEVLLANTILHDSDFTPECNPDPGPDPDPDPDPGPWEAESVNIKAYQGPSGGSAYDGEICVQFQDLYKCADCTELAAAYEFQYKTLFAPSFTAWEGFKGYRSPDLPYTAYVYLDAIGSDPSSWDGTIVRIRDKTTREVIETVIDTSTPIQEPSLQVACGIGVGGEIYPVSYSLELTDAEYRTQGLSTADCDASEYKFDLTFLGKHNITDPNRQYRTQVDSVVSGWVADTVTQPNEDFAITTEEYKCYPKGTGTPNFQSVAKIQYRFYTNLGTETVTDWIELDRSTP